MASKSTQFQSTKKQSNTKPCAICAEEKRSKRLHLICKTCKSDEQRDKHTCLSCWARLLTTCGEHRCIALHMKCPFCQIQIPFKVLKKSALWKSNAFYKTAYELQRQKLNDTMTDREDLMDMTRFAIGGMTQSPNLHSYSIHRQQQILTRTIQSHINQAEFIRGFSRYMRESPRWHRMFGQQDRVTLGNFHLNTTE